MSIGIVGAGNMGRSIATQLGKTGERVVLADRNSDKAEAVVAEIGAGDSLYCRGRGGRARFGRGRARALVPGHH